MNISEFYQALPTASLYSLAADRSLRQFIAAFWFEGALQGHVETRADGFADLVLCGENEHAQAFAYKIAVYPADHFGRHRLYGAMMDMNIDGSAGVASHDIGQIANNLLSAYPSQLRWRFINELIHTAVKQAYSLMALQACIQVENVDSLLELPYAWQEAQLGDGLFNPFSAHEVNQKADFAGSLMIIIELRLHGVILSVTADLVSAAARSLAA